MKKFTDNIIYLKLRDFLALFGVNKAVFFGLLSKVWLIFAGGFTVILIVYYFTPQLQGYYFTFYSLLALQMLVELGLTTVIVSFASHEWSKLGFDEKGFIVGDNNALSRLRSLARIVFIWYILGAIILSIGLGLAGYFFFLSSDTAAVGWKAPWFFLCLLTAIQLGFTPAFALLEGCNQVSQIYYFRFINEIVRSVASWGVIVLGGGLWAPAISMVFVVIWIVFFLTKNYLNYFKSLRLPITGHVFNWKKEIWPMQWRIAVSFISGYFFFNLFVPFMFHFNGAVAAGQIGMTWKVTTAILVTASLWIFARAPQFGILIAQKKYKDLDRLLLRSGVMATGIASVGATLFFIFILIINSYRYPLAERFLSPFPTVFFLATILMQISYAQSTYLRAHKQEPYMWLSAISSILMVFLLWFAGSRWGSLGVGVSYFSIVLFFVLPYGTIVWLRCRQRWHYDKNIISDAILPKERFLDAE